MRRRESEKNARSDKYATISLARERALFFGTDAKNSNRKERVRYAGKKNKIISKRTKGAVLVAPQLGQHPIRAPLLVSETNKTPCVHVSSSFVKACCCCCCFSCLRARGFFDVFRWIIFDLELGRKKCQKSASDLSEEMLFEPKKY